MGKIAKVLSIISLICAVLSGLYGWFNLFLLNNTLDASTSFYHRVSTNSRIFLTAAAISLAISIICFIASKKLS